MKRKQPLVVALLIAIAVLGWWLERRREQTEALPPEDALASAIAEKRSKVWVEGEGTIVKVLKDDRDPPRHQRCLLELPGGHTIKISHNIDLAPRVPWKHRGTLAFRGRFEWNDLGGVVHWTHHDPKGRRPGGWLKFDGKIYK